jgi:hypothetical protein
MLMSAGIRSGFTRVNVRHLESFTRPQWLYRAWSRVPPGEILGQSPLAVSESDVALCERLIDAFTAATGERRSTGETDGMWAWFFERYQHKLGEALQRRDPHALARLLASMFQEEFVSGMAYGTLSRYGSSWFGSLVLRLRTLDQLVSLAEALGVAPMENPEQGDTAPAFDGGIANLIASIDDALGLRVDFPKVGAPYGLAVDGRMIPFEMPDHIYAAIRLDQAIDTFLAPEAPEELKLVEIGGGYGGMCTWYLRMHPEIEHYTIVDLPVVNVLQGYFLSRTLGLDAVSLYGEPAARVQLLPSTALTEVETPFDVVVNKDSMPEMPREVMVSYLEWCRANCDGLLYSYNQETSAEFLGKAQGHVAEAIKQIGGFERLRRDESWMRRGYSEELYRPVARPAPPSVA